VVRCRFAAGGGLPLMAQTSGSALICSRYCCNARTAPASSAINKQHSRHGSTHYCKHRAVQRASGVEGAGGGC
jgi:hypothetical protein